MARFAQRAKVRETPVAIIRRWKGIDVHCDLLEIRSTLHLGTRYLLVEPFGGGEVIRSRHIKRAAAIKAADKPHRKEN